MNEQERRRKDELMRACSSGVAEMLRGTRGASNFGAKPQVHQGTHSLMVKCNDGEIYHIKVQKSAWLIKPPGG